MKIEFLGIPYSGKTFIKNELITELKKNKVKTQSYKTFFYQKISSNLKLSFLDYIIIKIMYYKTKLAKERKTIKLRKIKKKKYFFLNEFFSKRVKNLKQNSYNQFKKKNLNFSDLLRIFFIKNKNKILKKWIIDLCIAHYIYENDKKDNVILLDCEGFIHRLNSFMIENKNKNFPKNYLKFAPIPDVLIYINEKPKICLHRMKKHNIREDLIKFDKKLGIFSSNTKLIYQLVKKKCPKIFVINSKKYDINTKKDIVKYILSKQKIFG